MPAGILSCLPPGGRGTAKRWKEPAATKAENKTLLRADMESAPTKKGEISSRRHLPVRLRRISLAEGEYHPATVVGSCTIASLREGGGPRSGGRSPRAQKQRIRHYCGRIWNPPLRKKAKYQAAGISLSACGEFHSSKVNITQQLSWAVAPSLPSGREGDREAVEGARGRKSEEYHIAAGLSHEDSPVPIIPIEKVDIDQYYERHTVFVSKSQCPSWSPPTIIPQGGCCIKTGQKKKKGLLQMHFRICNSPF